MIYTRIRPVLAHSLLRVKEYVAFNVLLLLYFFVTVIELISNLILSPQVFARLRPRVKTKIHTLIDIGAKWLDRPDTSTVSRIVLINLAIRNMHVKKTRTIITIGGMAIGIAAIVFLVSIGYGLQELVIARVARLEEMRQADVIVQPGSNLVIDDATIAQFEDIAHVESVLPLIAMVGKVEYNNSVTDLPVYGVTNEYLDHSAVKPIEGHLFENERVSSSNRKVAPNFEDMTMVLGETTEATDATDAAVITSTSDPDVVIIASESATVESTTTKSVALDQKARKEAVVNLAMLNVLGIDSATAIDKTFSVAFVSTEDLLTEKNQRLQSTAATYKIIGVVPDVKAPYFYVPFSDLRSLGVSNYSQIKITVDQEKYLPIVRKSVEALGYNTKSVADTVDQINTLFGTLRILLASLGMIALGVATLGMFNTLTVSLLERTREVGLLKTMGMKSGEVRELFLTESIIMGFLGGILGLALGFVVGKSIGLVLSLFSFTKGFGYLDISYLPLPFILLILVLSLAVGVLTGIYPARRATRISALNALRYE